MKPAAPELRPEPHTTESDPIDSYLCDAHRTRRRHFYRGAAVLAAAAAACAALATRMTDIGHFAGFGGLGAGLLVGAAILWWNGRRS